MIHVTRLNHTEFVVNADLIETVEATPDTIVTLTTERKYVVRESVEEIIRRVVAFKRACLVPMYQQSGASLSPEALAQEGGS